MASSDQIMEECLYEQWMNLQQDELSELQQAAILNSRGEKSDTELTQLIERVMSNFETYVRNRRAMARHDILSFYAPTWCTTLEHSMLWIGGCRPSSYIRLIYALCGMDIESQLDEFLRGARIGNLGELSGHQLTMVDELQRKTIREERKLSTRLANLQEGIVDQPLAAVARNSSQPCNSSRVFHETLDRHGETMAEVLSEADELRIETTRGIISILSPTQAVEFLVASKKLRLCMREWGKKRDEDHGRCAN